MAGHGYGLEDKGGMSDALFPALADMQGLAGYVGVWVVYGIGLTVVFWTLGYLVWFIIQFFR